MLLELNPDAVPVAVCFLPEPAPNAARTVSYPRYLHHILRHIGLPYVPFGIDEIASVVERVGVLVTVGEHELPQDLVETLRQWLNAGGTWISIGGVCGLGDVLGVEQQRPLYQGWSTSVGSLGEGYAETTTAHAVCNGIERPLHFFGGIPVSVTSGTQLARVLDAHQRPTDRAAIVENKTGNGRTLFISIDLTGTIVRVQQGVGVSRDGVSSPDGTGPVADSVLKSDDGAVLDWIFDRQPVPGVTGLQGFLDPVADQWRDLLTRSILYMASLRKLRLPIVWYYPRNLPAIATMSHDTDNNEPEKCHALLNVLAEADVKTTWCVILPGYEEKLMRAIADAGHEYAMHYDAMTDGLEWSEKQFDRQWKELVKMFGGEKPVTNKNHYLRWEGDTELWQWCTARGIELDQSKGTSKPGEVGFNFGTCHPYHPVEFDNAQADGAPPLVYDLLELPTVTQDLEIFAPLAVLDPLLHAVVKHYGILHLLFHPAHVGKKGVNEAILHSVRRAREAGMEWWTGRQIVEWNRARSGIIISPEEDGSAKFSSDSAISGATVLWLRPAGGGAVKRWGFEFDVQVRDLAEGEEGTLSPPA